MTREERIEKLYEEARRRTLIVLRRTYPTISKEDREDAFQDTVVYIWSNEDFREPDPYKGDEKWYRMVAYYAVRRCLNIQRQAARKHAGLLPREAEVDQEILEDAQELEAELVGTSDATSAKRMAKLRMRRKFVEEWQNILRNL